MSGGWDELLGEAQQRLQDKQQEEEEIGAELGDQVELDEGEHFAGRWRGDDGTMFTKDGQISVFLLWDGQGAHRFHYKNARLVQEIDELRPAVGDEVLILRGPDMEYTAKGGEVRTMKRFAVRVRPSDQPLPDKPAPRGELASPDDDIPY